MSELFHQLGVDWKLLLSQGVNFLIVLVVLTLVAFRPLLKAIEERRKKIEFGLRGAEEAERKLSEIEHMKGLKLKETEKKALEILTQAGKEADSRNLLLLKEANDKAERLMRDAERVNDQRAREEMDNIVKEAKNFIRDCIVKVVNLKPSQIDEKLINQAIEIIKKQRI